MPVGYSIYQERASLVHQHIDPRSKMLWLVALFGIALCFSNAVVLAGVLLALFGVARLADLHWRDTRAIVLLSAWLVVLSVVIWPAYIPAGVRLFSVGPVNVTGAGLLFGLAMGLRIAIMLVASGLWMLTTSPQRLTGGLLAMGMPYKAGIALATTIRFIPLMNAERLTIIDSQRARGFDVSQGNPVQRVVRATPILIPLFARAFLTAQNLTVAMDARGFGARDGRTSILHLQFTTLDRVVCVVAIAALATAIALRLLGAPITLGTTL